MVQRITPWGEVKRTMKSSMIIVRNQLSGYITSKIRVIAGACKCECLEIRTFFLNLDDIVATERHVFYCVEPVACATHGYTVPTLLIDDSRLSATLIGHDSTTLFIFE